MQTQFERLTDGQWEIIKLFLDWQRKREIDLRDVFDAILSLTRTGTQWRNLDSQFPDCTAVYYYFNKWTRNGALERINVTLNVLERTDAGREATPSLCIADSQSVKLAPMIFEDRGIDGNKKVNGRKRQLLVDTRGRIWKVRAHAANQHDSPAGAGLVEGLRTLMPRLRKVMADKSYRGTFCRAVEDEKLSFETPQREEGAKGFAVQAKRWVVERTIAWLKFFRRVVIDYEHTLESSQSFLILANISMSVWRISYLTK